MQQCDATSAGNAGASKFRVLAQVGWAAAILGLTDLAETCASSAAGSQDLGSRTWADLIRAQQQIAQDKLLRYMLGNATLLSCSCFLSEHMP